MLEIAFRPDPRSGLPLPRQLAEALRAWIEAGRLAPGEKLPATRELARALGLGRNTVSQAYERLSERGLATAHVGQGTFVARGARAAAPREPGVGREFVWESLFAERSRPRSLPRLAAPARHPRFDLRPGRVAAAALPGGALRRAASAVLRGLPSLANALEPGGLPALRAEIARALVARGIACEADEVLVVHGAQQALDLVARALLEPGDAVAVEQPGYFGAALAFGAAQAALVPIGVDAEGLRTAELARALRARRLKLVYATPAVQCPSGVALGEERRRELLALADAHQTPILEDDYDCVLRLGERAAPALKALDLAGQVVYVGTFSKALFPGLRLGYLVAARGLRERLRAIQLAADFGPSPLVQALVLELLQSGALERHVRRVRRLYAERLEALLGALRAMLPEESWPSPPAGGTALWLRLPARVDAEAVHAAAAEAGLAYARGEEFFLDGRGVGCLYLSYATHPPAELAEAGAALGRIVRQALARRPRRPAAA